MITEKEITNINLGFENIKECISRMIAMLDLIKSKQNSLIIILESRYHENGNIRNQFSTLLQLRDMLLDLNSRFQNIPTITANINEHYKTFLQSEIMTFNPENKHLIDSNSTRQIQNFIDKQNTTTPIIEPSDNIVIDWLHYLPAQYQQYTSEINTIFSRLYIFNQIKGIDGNIVMIGANGSGKSTFSRQLNGNLSNNIVILSAQHFLYYSKGQNISTAGNEIEKVRNFQRNIKLSNDGSFMQLITSDMNDLVNALVSEYTDCAFECYENHSRKESYLSRTISLWNSVIEHRNLINDRTGLYVSGDKIPSYEFNQLSDGEKAVFYYIGHILLAQNNSYIIVDEPENHLNLTICNKLWDLLEQNRPDCKFVYLTHNLNFATTRTNSTILWNKKFSPPADWSFEILPTNEIIPEVLVMELVGSRKNICFCEGNNQSSIDYKLYSILFPNYTIVPVAGHRDVIDYVNSYNSTSTFITKAVGIIDGDYHLPAQITKWKEKSIYTLPINEIENILCDNRILSSAIDSFCSPNNALDLFHDAFWKLLEENKYQQATLYVNNYINELFKENFLREKSNIQTLIFEFSNITSSEKIKSYYDNILNTIEKFIAEKDYTTAIRFVNFKGRLTKDIAKKTIVDKYENRVLDLIKKDNSLQQYIIETYFSDFKII